MILYLAKFNGREKGALGIDYDINVIIETNETEKEKLILKLYDKYEHCIGAKFVKLVTFYDLEQAASRVGLSNFRIQDINKMAVDQNQARRLLLDELRLRKKLF